MQQKSGNIGVLLLVEDDLDQVWLLCDLLNDEPGKGPMIERADSIREAEQYLARRAADVILLDIALPDAGGITSIRRARAASPHTPLVVLTGSDDDALAMQALQEGAQDYLIKGQIDCHGLLRSLRYAIERKTWENALFAEKERAEVTLSSIGEAVICTDVSGKVTFINRVAETLTGWPLRDATGLPLNQVFQATSNSRDDLGPVPSGAEAMRTFEARRALNFTLVQRDGREIPIEQSIAPIHDRQGRATGAVIVFRDVSKARAMARQIRHAAEHDYLTGLPNRMLLDDRITQAIASAQRNRKQIALLYLDIDGFKEINDSLGHAFGDLLLQSIARRLVSCVRRADTVCRQGGDEFVVLLSELTHGEHAAIMAGRILNAVAECHTINGQEMTVTTSIGVSIYPDDALDAETLIKSADTAMYQAKENGRQSYQFFKPAMKARATERQSLEEGLRRALDRQEFVLHYQPKIDLRTGVIIGAEALLRWAHPVRGAIPPAQFIPIAEESGLILPIGRWVLREACAQARDWSDAGLPSITMAVNVAALEFRNADFLATLGASLEASRLDPSLLELDVSESVLMKRVESTESILHALRKLGTRVAVDDFGTGYSSLNYLRKFPIDALKIDQSFVGRISGSEDDAAIVTAAIGLARSLGLGVVAEGVETLGQLQHLEAQRCDQAQGYYFSHPLPARIFAELLARRGSGSFCEASEAANSRRKVSST